MPDPIIKSNQPQAPPIVSAESALTRSLENAGETVKQDQPADGDAGDASFLASLEKAKQDDAAAKGAKAATPAVEGVGQPDAKPPEPGKSKLDVRPKTPAKAAQWDELKSAHAEEVKRLNAQIEELRGKVPARETEAALRELDQYKEAFRSFALERDPEFKAKFDTKRSSILGALRAAAGDEVAKLAEGPWNIHVEARIDALTKDMDTGAKRRVASALNALDQLSLERQTEIDMARAGWEKRVSDAQAESKKALTARASTFDNVLAQFSDAKEGFVMLQPSNDATRNTAVAETVSLARDIFAGKVDAEDAARAALLAAIAPQLVGAIAELERENAALRGKVGAKVKATPGAQPSKALGEEATDDAPAPGTPEYDIWFTRRLQEAQKQR